MIGKIDPDASARTVTQKKPFVPPTTAVREVHRTMTGVAEVKEAPARTVR